MLVPEGAGARAMGVGAAARTGGAVAEGPFTMGPSPLLPVLLPPSRRA